MRNCSLPLLLLALTWAVPAHAHGAMGSAAPFWSGVFHFAVSPVAIAATLGFMATVAFADDRTVLHTMGVAALCAFAAVLWTPAAWLPLAPLGPVIAGLLAVSAWRAQRWLYLAIAAVSGAAVGIASDPDTRTWGVAFGVAVVMLVIASGGIELFLWIKQRERWGAVAEIGRRVLGAWIAAIGLLLGALFVFGVQG